MHFRCENTGKLPAIVICSLFVKTFLISCDESDSSPRSILQLSLDIFPLDEQHGNAAYLALRATYQMTVFIGLKLHRGRLLLKEK